jgi:hypothetical protein
MTLAQGIGDDLSDRLRILQVVQQVGGNPRRPRHQ